MTSLADKYGAKVGPCRARLLRWMSQYTGWVNLDVAPSPIWAECWHSANAKGRSPGRMSFWYWTCDVKVLACPPDVGRDFILGAAPLPGWASMFGARPGPRVALVLPALYPQPWVFGLAPDMSAGVNPSPRGDLLGWERQLYAAMAGSLDVPAGLRQRAADVAGVEPAQPEPEPEPESEPESEPEPEPEPEDAARRVFGSSRFTMTAQRSANTGGGALLALLALAALRR